MIYLEYIDNVDNRDNFNTNNHEKHPNDVEAMNKDYKKEIFKTHLSNYMDLINYPVEWTYTFTQNETKLLSDICKIGIQVLRRPKIFSDEIEQIVDRVNKNWVNGEWFVRSDSASPKDSMIKFPYRNPTELIDGIITSRRFYLGVLDNIQFGKETVLYFVKYGTNWNIERELRCFVRNKKLTAISQYDWFRYGFFCHLSEPELKRIAENVDLLVCDIVDKITEKIETDDFVVDLYVNDDGSLKIVELNSFGYWLASGSALFHWITDKDKLYNDLGNIYFRILKKNT